ncbi:substrate-binding domain-containing protein [Blautia stercoris]|jgi:phosphate transport system substrate-binding protein|nr:phosphate ABC transporter substrate-binding protein [Firmicutes bacterium AM10-47]RHV44408.1 phosphate ABC transporter substrate-binding protein [Firmicutes bacterium OM04-13BH]
MKKKLAALLITGIMAAAMTACGSSNSGTDNSGSTDGTAKTESSADAGSDWDNTRDITVVSREDGSGTRGAFVELFGIEEEVNGEKVDMTTEEANITNSTSVMMSTVAQDEYAIGYISLGSLDDSVKAVKVDGSEATAENIKNGSYKISRPFNIATKEDLSDAAQDFEDFILSTEGQKVVEDNKYIPLDDVSDYKSNGASGKVVVAGSSSVSPVMEKLKEAYQAVNSDVEVEIQTSDSTTGMQNAIDGVCDIGMASRELKDSEKEAGLTPTVIAMDGIAVVVNNDNPTDELSSDQVKSIFTGDVLTWDEALQ